MNTLTGYLPLNIFQHLPNVKELHVLQAYTKMAAPKNGHFLLAEKLLTIHIVNQRIEDLGAKVFEGATAVEAIHLDNNEIATLDEDTFVNLKHLAHLTLSSNEIKSLPERIFSSLKALEKLDLSSNLLHALPAKIFDSNRNLQDIKFQGNRMLQIPEIKMFEESTLDFSDCFCIDRKYEKTSELNSYTKEHCQLDVKPFDMVISYREQNEIDQVCENKDMLPELVKQLREDQQLKTKAIDERDELEFEIIKTKIYKNSMCT